GGPQGEGAKRPRAGGRRHGRGAGRGHRASRAAALRSGDDAPFAQAAAVAVGPTRALPRAVTIARGLNALWLSRHLRIVGWVGHVPPSLGGVVLVHVQQRLQRVDGFVDRGVAIAQLGKARGHGRDREVLRRDFGELVPRDRCGDRRARFRPDAVGRGNRAIAGVLVVVDEDALAALFLPPVGRGLAW